MTDPARPYGEGRIRSNVSYADVERAAIAILKSKRRPTVETIRETTTKRGLIPVSLPATNAEMSRAVCR